MESLTQRKIKKAIKGNKKAFSECVWDLRLDGYRLAYYFLKNEADSQDALSSGIEKAYSGISQLKDSSSFKSWFLNIVANEAKMILRKQNKLVYIEDFISTLPHRDSVEGEVINRLDLDKLLNSLDEDDRVIVLLKARDLYTFSEIGFMLELNENTVKSQYYRSIQKMRNLYDEEEKNNG